MKKNMINIILFVLFNFGCGSNKNDSKVLIQKSETINVSNQRVSITFYNKPDINDSYNLTPTNLYRPNKIISYVNGIPYTENTLSLTTKKFPQIFHFEVKNEYFILRLNVNAFDVNDYLIEKGDSIEVKYLNSKPIVSIINRNVKPYDYSLEDFTSDKKNSGKYTFFGNYFNVSTLYLQKMLNDKNFMKSLSSLNPEQKMLKKIETESEIKNNLLKENKSNLITTINIIDSLYKNELLSKSQYLFYHNKYSFIKDIVEVESNSLTIDKIQEKLNDSNLSSDIYKGLYYQKFLEAIEDKFIIPKTNYIDLGDFVNKDYRIAYNLVNESVLLKNQNRSYLLHREIDRIAKSFSNKDFLEYFSRFEKDVNDTVYINHIKNKYSLKFNDKKNETNSLVLMSSDKKQITFDDLKKRHAGKLIYVDFWASWCAPCRKAMPSSIKLKDKNKDIIFVYLSMDSTIEPWQKAMVDEKINNYSESYLIINSETSNFLKKQNVSAIPRYMIFDKKGTLAFANAPSVESKKLESTFAKLLK